MNNPEVLENDLENVLRALFRPLDGNSREPFIYQLFVSVGVNQDKIRIVGQSDGFKGNARDKYLEIHNWEIIEHLKSDPLNETTRPNLEDELKGIENFQPRKK